MGRLEGAADASVWVDRSPPFEASTRAWDLFVAGNDDVWVLAANSRRDTLELAHWTGADWMIVQAPVRFDDREGGPELWAGPDGTVWVAHQDQIVYRKPPPR